LATFDSNLNRNGLIAAAYRKIGVIRAGALPNPAQLQEGIKALNVIIREEDGKQTGSNKSLWAIKTSSFPLIAGGYIYASGDELRTDILDVVSVYFRDTGGADISLDLITKEQYDAIGDKNETGEPKRVYFEKNKDLSSLKVHIHPAPTSISSSSEVTGTDGTVYRCIMGHTSADVNKPVTGTSFSLYWDVGLEIGKGGTGGTWVTATNYDEGEHIIYSYKRPLFDFDNATDNPDMPSEWTSYLMWRLAHDLSPEYHITLDERLWLERRYVGARAEIFPATQAEQNDHHNKSLYY